LFPARLEQQPKKLDSGKRWGEPGRQGHFVRNVEFLHEALSADDAEGALLLQGVHLPLLSIRRGFCRAVLHVSTSYRCRFIISLGLGEKYITGRGTLTLFYIFLFFIIIKRMRKYSR
jgi:hypothetical protein